ncbi:MAG: hypothetical protein K2P81_12240 [Bacteriovoracaceae bacterium]|nr:hypothetical protein [Bacteriovoracaceae bacterium]
MKKRLLTSVLLFSLSPSMVLAQSLPDEVDHVRYQSVLQNLQGQLSDARAYVAKLQQEQATLRQDIERMSLDRRQLPARNEELSRNIQNRQAQIAGLENEIRSLSVTVDRIAQDLGKLEAQLNQMRQSWSQEENRRIAITNQFNAVTQDLRRLQAQLDREVGEERESMALLDRLTREINALQGRRQDLANQHRDRQAQNQADQRDLPAVRRQADQFNAQLQTASTQLAPAEQALTQIQADLRAKEAELAQANASIAPFQKKVDAAASDLKSSSDALAALQKSSSDAQANITSMEQRKASAGTQMTNLQNVRSSQNSQVLAAQADLDAKNLAASQATQKLQITQQALEAARTELREAAQRGDRAAMAQISQKMRNLETVLRRDQEEASAAGQVALQARTVLEQKTAALAATDTQISNLQAFLNTVDADIQKEKDKIASNASQIETRKNEVAQKTQTLKAAQGELAAVSGDRDRLVPVVNQLRAQAAQAQANRDRIAGDVQRLRDQAAQANARVNDIQSSIATFQQDMQRLENQAALVGRDIQVKSQEADREQRLLARIRQDRITIQQQVGSLQQNADQISRDLDQQERTTRALEAALRQKETERNQLAGYLSDNRRSLDQNIQNQNAQQTAMQNEQAELQRNTERLANIDRDFTVAQSRISQVMQEIPTVNNQISALSTQVSGADSQYRQRLGLYNKYLGEAQGLGASRGTGIGSTDGQKAGVTLANTTATKLGVPSGSEEGRFEALLRGLVRGEIAGFNTGRDQGLASAADASRGTQEGTAAGTREARDYAEQVLKPRYYNNEFTRRLNDPDIRDEVVLKLASIAKSLFGEEGQKNQKALLADIPVVSSQEMALSQSIQTSLDERITSAIKELARLRDEQTRLGNAQAVYLSPGNVVAPVESKNCDDVYKRVADFVAACQASFKSEYTDKYVAAHKSNFMSNYAQSFQSVIAREKEAVIQRDFAANYKEGEAVARAVGLAVGKQEVYQARFAEARTQAYQTTLASEDARVKTSATSMVDELFAANGVPVLSEDPRLSSKDRFGISPGAAVSMDVVLKNAGAQATAEGGVKVRILEISPILNSQRTLAPLKSLPARKLVRTQADFGLKVSDQAEPGQKVRVVAELTYPGNDYAASRVQKVEMQEVLGLNPSATVDVSFDANPTVSGFLGITKTHDVGVNLGALYKGLDKGYDVTLEEVGSNFVSFKDKDDTTKVLGQGQSEKAVLSYKLSKSARGKDVVLKVVVRYAGQVLEERTLNIKPQ